MRNTYFLIALVMALFTNITFGSVKFFNSSNVDLGHQNDVKCSTGMTCSVSAGKLVMVSSPSLVGPLTLENGEIINNTTDDVVEVISNDEITTLRVSGFEAKDAILNLYADQGDDAADKFGLKYSTADALTFEVNGSALATMTGSTGAFAFTGPLSGDGGDAISGFLQNMVTATATTLTAAQCGSSFINSGAVEVELPEASTVVGCRYTFITANASNFDVDPDAGDQILVLTNAAGDAIRNATLGNSVTIQAINSSQWVQISAIGTYTDIN